MDVLETEEVILKTLNLSQLLEKTLKIPEYQRIYCWTEKNVIRLLEDIRGLEKEYRLGTIILQNKNSEYDIIDGQQRLITLSLIIDILGNSFSNNLLNEKLCNDEAIEYIAYNKYLIENYLSKFKKDFDLEKILNYLTFSVLILNDSSLELAYTFFSNENSRGCPLTDFDLLKAHHLRYVNIEVQATHLAKNWDEMVLKYQDDANINKDYDYKCTLGLYIFRLRKWLNFDDWNENEKWRVKNEFEAALIMKQIPPFGEQFQYKEPIQGGSHFFAYVSNFVTKFNNFKDLPQYKLLHSKLTGESHTWFRDVIEALLFAYYLKFGIDYISDALILIARVISQARYDNRRIHKETIFDYAKTSKITMIIDRATSPTFFLAELNSIIKLLDDSQKDSSPICKRYYNLLFGYGNSIINSLKNLTDLTIVPSEVF